MDVWEHAFILDHGTARAKYIDSFFSNIDWETVNERVESPAAICG
jgi:Fe-Mn family superoxide dismutase